MPRRNSSNLSTVGASTDLRSGRLKKNKKMVSVYETATPGISDSEYDPRQREPANPHDPKKVVHLAVARDSWYFSTRYEKGKKKEVEPNPEWRLKPGKWLVGSIIVEQWTADEQGNEHPPYVGTVLNGTTRTRRH
jgi:hypothetical protein